jgi:tRNA threonylcarbamoyladenosine biosynthesis protein TsaB
MRILAIDTSLTACSAAVFDAAVGAVLAIETMLMARGHAEALMPLIARVMDQGAIEFAELDRVAVTVGPGSFTGLRVGISAARGIALAAGKPVVGVSTLAAFAAPYIAEVKAEAVIVAIDARNGNVFFQAFGVNGRTLVPPQHAPLDEALRAVETPAYVTGPAARLLADHWPEDRPTPLDIDVKDAPEIDWVAQLGAVADPQLAPAKPVYLRAPDARPQEAARLPRQ